MRLSQRETNTDIRLRSASAGVLGSFWRAAVLPSDTLPLVYTSHAGSSQSRRQDFAQSHLLGISPLFRPPCETMRLSFYIKLPYSFTTTTTPPGYKAATHVSHLNQRIFQPLFTLPPSPLFGL